MSKTQYIVNCSCGESTIKELEKSDKTFCCPKCGKITQLRHHRNTHAWDEEIYVEPIEKPEDFYKNVPSYFERDLSYETKTMAQKVFKAAQSEHNSIVAIECIYRDSMIRSMLTHAYISLWLIVSSPIDTVLNDKSFYESELLKMKVIVGAISCNEKMFKEIFHHYLIIHKPRKISYKQYASDFCRSAIMVSTRANSKYPTSICNVPFIKNYAKENDLNIS